jgi:hypothetical protein
MSRSEPASRRSCWTSPLAWTARCGLGAALYSCGGVAFTEADFPPDGGTSTMVQDAAMDVQMQDGSTTMPQDSSSAIDARDSAIDAQDSAQSIVDSSIADTCSTSPMPENCGITPAQEPSTLCVFQITATVSTGEYITIPTPSACASWCTFSCACLLTAKACGTGTPSCMPHVDGTIILECDDR